MAINIQSLFSDIIETPAQPQERMLTEGILKGRELTGGLTGLARTQAPLVSALSMQMPQRQEALRRSVGGMLGLDVRTESEKVQEALQGVDPNDPQSLLQAAQTVGNLGLGAQSAQMRAMAADATRQKQADLMAQQDFAMGQAESAQSIAESRARTGQLEETVRQSIAGDVREAANETTDYMTAQNIFRASKDILQKVSPYLAGQIESLFPPTVEGASKAREFALELAKSPEEKEREFREVTIINKQTGMPEIVLFDDNDETYRRVLGVDDAALEANGGKKFSNVSTTPGQALTSEAFSAKSHAEKLLSIAFNPNLEQMVGPREVRRAVPTFMLTPDAAALRNEIDRSITNGTLPIIRAFAPVTQTDVELLQNVQLNFRDSQEVWVQKTIEENVPQSLNVLERSLIEDGQGLSAAHQMRLATSEEILLNVVNNPGVFGDYSLEEATSQAISLLPNANRIDVKEIPDDITIFKSPNGTIFSAEIIQVLRERQQLSEEEIIENLDLTLIER